MMLCIALYRCVDPLRMEFSTIVKVRLSLGGIHNLEIAWRHSEDAVFGDSGL